jgi:hypothetical protein
MHLQMPIGLMFPTMLGPCAVIPYNEAAYYMERYGGPKAYQSYNHEHEEDRHLRRKLQSFLSSLKSPSSNRRSGSKDSSSKNSSTEHITKSASSGSSTTTRSDTKSSRSSTFSKENLSRFFRRRSSERSARRDREEKQHVVVEAAEAPYVPTLKEHFRNGTPAHYGVIY